MEKRVVELLKKEETMKEEEALKKKKASRSKKEITMVAQWTEGDYGCSNHVRTWRK
jgi:hypothetical protein